MSTIKLAVNRYYKVIDYDTISSMNRSVKYKITDITTDETVIRSLKIYYNNLEKPIRSKKGEFNNVLFYDENKKFRYSNFTLNKTYIFRSTLLCKCIYVYSDKYRNINAVLSGVYNKRFLMKMTLDDLRKDIEFNECLLHSNCM